ncbi:MAG: ABC-F family ATP-binding cassette domain-containing protein [Candidatus Eisenbacteria bacterium]|nr:ABC-F family ATP-binding cassette domain-containing protein [Candidatus Eisenbacteria bacterium]
MLKAMGIHRGFATQSIFEGVDWFVGDRDRVGLVGPNGSGKSTWLKMLAGEESPNEGRFETPKGYRIGYLPQFSFRLGTGTVRQEARAAFEPLLALRREQESLEREMEANPAEAESLLGRVGHLEEQFKDRGGYDIDRKVDRVLRGLGFSLADFERLVGDLSGGWQMRVALARLLLEQPDLLLLDEPTNHLDIEARDWLEGFLAGYPGSFVVVSHDRFFLDRTVNRVSDIMQRKLVDYSGNYSKFLTERERRYDAAMKAWERQQEEIKRIERFIERFKAKNTKATQAQSRVKMLEKIERLEKPVLPPKTIHFKFPSPDRSERIVFRLEDVAKSYGSLQVFEKVDLLIERGQKVALVGPNGAGKSTLMRILADQEPIDRGERVTGKSVKMEFFAQDAADRLPKDLTVLRAAEDQAPTSFIPQVRGLLGAFLFSGPAVDKPIPVLSGGERNRLALALMLMTPSNLFLMDEPTNHLDMDSKDVLLHALKTFEGTVVFVSHDRFFLSNLADRVIEVGGGTIYDYPGDYESFLVHKAEREAAQLAAEERAAGRGGGANASRSGVGGAGVSGADSSAGGVGESNGDGGGKRKASAHQLKKLEDEIAELEEKKAKLGELLSRGEIYADPAKSAFYTKEYQEIAEKLDSALESWAELAE